MITTHLLIPGKYILECPRQHMMNTWLSIRSRRTLIKNVFQPTLVLLFAFVEDAVLAPKPELRLFHVNHFEFRRDMFKHTGSVKSLFPKNG
jgi:hypothetical protein